MKKVSIVGILMLSLLWLSACESTTALMAYEKASEKTQAIEKGSTHISSLIELPKDQSEEPITFSLEGDYRDFHEKGIYKGHFEIGGLGQDFTFYQVSPETQYLHLDLIGKYINLSKAQDKGLKVDKERMAQEDVFVTFVTKVQGIWHALLAEENVMRGEKVLIENPDGDVKATKYTINLSEAQRLEVIQKIVSYYKQEREMFEPAFAERFQMTRDDWREMANKVMTEWTLSTFSVKAYVDYDDYIISEAINMTFSTEEGDLAMTLKTSNYHINQEVDLVYPEISDDQWMDVETLDQEALQ